MTGSAAKGAESAELKTVPDLSQRLAKFRRVEIPFRATGITSRERKLIDKLVDACRDLEDIYWRQVDPDGLELYQSLLGSTSPKDEELRRYLWINGSRYDLLDEHKPFVGSTPILPGRGFYPVGLTRSQIEQYVDSHPEKKNEIYSTTTIVRWHDQQLEGVPYHIAYRSFLEPAAKDLREAARLSDDPAFATYLRLRADALLSDDYFKSDLAWLDMKNPKFDVIFAPYETYDDDLLGVKATYGAAVMIRDEEESRKLAVFQKYVADMQDSLPLAAEDRPSRRGLETPMEVMHTPFRSGDLTHGYQAVADDLPNDPRVQEKKGSKRLFFKDFMDARVEYIVLPVARDVMLPHQAEQASSEGYLLTTVLHEICHGLGPLFARTASGKTDIRESIGPVYSGLEEAKADVAGMYALKWLVDHDVLPKSHLDGYYATYIAELFRTVRFGIGEAHAQAAMMEFNFVVEKGALKRQPSGRYSVDYARMPDTLSALAKTLLQMEATGDRAAAENWFKKYDVMPEELRLTLKSAAHVPVDVDPVFSFKQTVQ